MIVVNYLLLILMAFLGSIASVFFKKASSTKGIKELLKNWNSYIGIILYMGSAVINIYLLRVMDYVVVLPLTCLTYVFTIFISYFVFKEKITIRKIIGIFIIIGGVVLIVI